MNKEELKKRETEAAGREQADRAAELTEATLEGVSGGGDLEIGNPAEKQGPIGCTHRDRR